MNLRSCAAILCVAIIVVMTISIPADAGVMSGPSIVGKIEGGGVSVVQLYADDGDGVLTASDVMTDSLSTDADGGFVFQDLDTLHEYFVMYGAQVSELQRIGDIKSYIDSFDITQTVTSTPVSGFRIDTADGPLDKVLGGVRDLYIEVFSGPAEGQLRSNPYSLTSSLQIDMSAGVSGMAAVTWDGVAGGMVAENGLNVDLTNSGAYSGISLGLAVDRAGAGQLLQLIMHSAGETSMAEVEFPVTPDVSPSSMLYVPFADFVGTADPTQVSSFQLVIDDAKPSLDARITDIGLTGPNPVSFPVVPEPTTGGMLVGTLLVACACRRGRAVRKSLAQD